MMNAGLLACKLPNAASRFGSALRKTNFQQLRSYRGRTQNVRVAPQNVSSFGIKAVGAGQMAVGAGAVAGVGALCFYGLGLGNEQGAIDRAVVWPEHVRTRVRDTYGYMCATLGVVAASATTVFRSPQGQRLLMLCERHPIASTVGIIASMVGTSMAMRSVPYTEGLGAKQGLWLLNAATLGLVVAPIGVLGGAIAMRAAWYTAGIVGGLSTVAVCAPSDKFLSWGAPLGVGLGVVFCASMASMVVPPTGALGLGLHSIVMYGGLLLFSCFLLYDTQKVIKKAENHREGHVWTGYEYATVSKFDPINASHHIVMDILNIFVRIAQMLAMGGGRRK